MGDSHGRARHAPARHGRTMYAPPAPAFPLAEVCVTVSAVDQNVITSKMVARIDPRNRK